MHRSSTDRLVVLGIVDSTAPRVAGSTAGQVGNTDHSSCTCLAAARPTDLAARPTGLVAAHPTGPAAVVLPTGLAVVLPTVLAVAFDCSGGAGPAVATAAADSGATAAGVGVDAAAVS